MKRRRNILLVYSYHSCFGSFFGELSGVFRPTIHEGNARARGVPFDQNTFMALTALAASLVMAIAILIRFRNHSISKAHTMHSPDRTQKNVWITALNI